MGYTDDEVNLVYDRTGGYCFYCDKHLSFKNYGTVGRKGAWEIDHFIPISRNGAHQRYNWVPACVNCNTEKSDLLPWEYDPDTFRYRDRDPENYI